jgi:hypothetical protein
MVRLLQRYSLESQLVLRRKALELDARVLFQEHFLRRHYLETAMPAFVDHLLRSVCEKQLVVLLEGDV